MADKGLEKEARDSNRTPKGEAFQNDASQEIKGAVGQIWRSFIFTEIRLEAHTLSCLSKERMKIDGKIDEGVSPVDVAKFIITHYFTFATINDGSSAKQEGILVAYELSDETIAPRIPIRLNEDNKRWLKENGGTHIGSGGLNYAELRFMMLALSIQREQKEKRALRALVKEQIRKKAEEYGSVGHAETVKKYKTRYEAIRTEFAASMNALQNEASTLMKADLNGLLNITEKEPADTEKRKVKV